MMEPHQPKAQTGNMTSEQDDKIKDRIRKLVRLGESDNEHEAALAMQRVQEMLATHNLEPAEVEQVDAERIHVAYKAKRRKQRWARIVWGATANAWFCKYWTEPSEDGDIHHSIGTSTNVPITADYIGDYVSKIEQLAVKYKRAKDEHDRQSFKLGCAETLKEGLNAKRAADERRERERAGPVVRDGKQLPTIAGLYHAHEAANEEYFKENFPDLELRSSTRSTTSRHEAYKAGREAGKSISLDPQIHKSHQKLIGKS